MVMMAQDIATTGCPTTHIRPGRDWEVNQKRVERIWGRVGLKVPHIQPKRARLCLNDGPCVRPQPLGTYQLWAYDFAAIRTRDSK